jgi:hypothetical protein
LSRTAEKSNIPWREMTKKVLESDVYEVFERIRDPNIVYPDCEFITATLIFLHQLICINRITFTARRLLPLYSYNFMLWFNDLTDHNVEISKKQMH